MSTNKKITVSPSSSFEKGLGLGIEASMIASCPHQIDTNIQGSPTMGSRAGSGRPRKTTSANGVDYDALSEFRFALRKFLAFSEAAAREAGVSPQQHQALLSIKGSSNSELSVQELSDRLFIQHNSAVELVDRLVQGQLAIRGVDSNDG